MEQLIEVINERGVGRVWLNRPKQLNALTPDLVAELESVLHALALDESVRVLVLGGRGASFCAGVDLAVMQASANASFEANLEDAQRMARLFASVADFPKPIVGRLQGNVFGGGVGLACACDIPIASDDAHFSLSEVRLGILPAVISPYVIRRLGDRNARELMLTGERIGAASALRLGLVQAVTAVEDLDARIEERVKSLLAGAPQAQARIKGLLSLYNALPWEEYRASTPRTLAEVRSGEEARDGLAAFFEKRKPKWAEQDPTPPPAGA